MKVRLPNFDERLSSNLTPGEKRQLVLIPPVPPVAPIPIPPVFTPPAPALPVPVPAPVPPAITGTAASRPAAAPAPTSSSSRTVLSSSSTRTTSSSIATSSSISTSTSISTTTTPLPTPPDTSLIFVNSFPTDFPVETRPAQQTSIANGKGYVFMKDAGAADSMLLFVVFFVVTLFLTLFFLRLTRYIDARRDKSGQKRKEDQMVSEETRWQEGRLVTERKIVRDVKGGKDGGGAGGGAGGVGGGGLVGGERKGGGGGGVGSKAGLLGSGGVGYSKLRTEL